LRNKTLHTPAVFDITASDLTSTPSKTSFMYKACQPSWGINDKILNATKAQVQYLKTSVSNTTNATVITVPDSCANMSKSNAYMMEGGECLYSFPKGEFAGIDDPENEDKTKGFTLTYVSNENCTSDASKKFTFTINAVCDRNGTEKTTGYKKNVCNAEITHTGKEACAALSFNIDDFFTAIGPFLGIILLVFGTAMTFAGNKLLLLAFAALIFLGVTGATFMVVYNLFLSNATMGVYVTVAIISSILGGVAAYFSQKFAKAWATTLLAAWAGFVAISFLVKLVGIYNQYATFTLTIIGTGLAAYFGRKLDKHIKSFGTAFIGSYLLIRGIGVYAGGYPSESAIAKQTEAGNVAEYNPLVWAYFAGFIFFIVAGTFVQFKYLKKEDDKGDAFE